MLKNLLTVAWRSFFRQKFYSIINVLGLASGLACTLFIYLWVHDEVTKDRFHSDHQKIFNIVSNLRMNDGEILTWDVTPGPLAEEIHEHSSEVELVARTQNTGSMLFQYNDKGFMERGFYADPDFFKIFSFPVIAGTVSDDPNRVSEMSISKQLAEKLFGNEDPIGKIIKANRNTDYTIVAVFDHSKVNTALEFSFVLPFEIYKKQRGDGFSWGNFDHPLYVKLHDESKHETFVANLHQRLKTVNSQSDVTFYVQPLADRYLFSQFENGIPVGGRIKYVQIFSVVALFILVIACINFMNMATARAANRSKEVGVRKVVGAHRRSLVLQFLSESLVISTISMLVAVCFVYLFLPLFNLLVEKQIAIDFLDPLFLGGVSLIVMITGLLAGSYPAIFLSSYQPVSVLKGSAASTSNTASGLRKTLVVFQFSLTVILIASSLVIYQQITFIMSKDVGYNRSSVISFPLRGDLSQKFDVFKQELKQFPGIENVARGDQSLVQVNNQNGSVDWPGEPENSQVFFRTVVVDFDYLETLGVKLKEGRMFSREFNDTSAFVITSRAAEVMGLYEPIGQTISQWGMKGKIVGVVDDFHSRSLHESIDPIIFMCNPKWTGTGFIRMNGENISEVLANVRKVYSQYAPDYPFNYAFLDDDFARLYKNEKVAGSLALIFTFMAIIISGLGLLALAAYSAEKRKKEISIRKTLGASVQALVTMMSKDFLKLSLTASIIGCPLAWLLMREYLNGYAYHTELDWLLFVVTATAAMLLSLLLVIFQVTKAALANPVDALRNE